MVDDIKIPSDAKLWPIEKLTHYDKNARTHSQEQIEQIAASMLEYGFTNPILVDENHGILAGHGRLMAANHLGLKLIPVIVLSHLTPDQKRAYVIADNQLALNAGWDDGILHKELEALRESGFDLSLTGFSQDDLDRLIPEVNTLQPQDADDERVPELQKKAISVPGDIWVLGKHRVMCGDSKSITDLDRLMSGKLPTLVFTDPPYGINYQDVKGNHRKIEGDATLDGIRELLALVLAQQCPLFICCNWKCYSEFESAMREAQKSPKACIVWDKTSRVQNLDKFGKQHEFILYYGPFGGEPTVDVDVWECKRQVLAEHPTAKPIELIERALGHFQKGRVLDLFGGSGSTMIAAEKSGWGSSLMELDPKYVDVIVRRWQEYTGKTAKLDSTGETFAELETIRKGK